MLLLAGLSVIFYQYGHLSNAAHEEKTAAFDRMAAARGEELCCEGWIASYPQYRYGGMTFEFETRVGGEEESRVRILVKTNEYLVGYGDSLRVCGRVYHGKGERRVSYGRYLKGRGLVGELRAPPGGVERLGGNSGNPVFRSILWPVHQRVRCDLVRGLGARSGIPVALLIGERGFLGRKTPGIFAGLGLSHLLALSGLHLGFVAAAAYLLLRALGCRSGLLLIAVLAIYVGIVGFIVSLARALAMAILLIVASMIHRPLKPVSALGNALLLLLLFVPTSFFALGFQLSFLATYGVLRCVALIDPVGDGASKLRRLWFGVRSSLMVSISAQLFVAPIIIACFERVSVMSPLATLIFVVPVAVVLGGSALCAGLSSLWPAAAQPCFWVLERFLMGFGAVVDWASAVTPDRVAMPFPDIYLYYAGLAVLYHANVRKRTRVVGIALVVIAVARATFF
jgi:competence protein ComEC